MIGSGSGNSRYSPGLAASVTLHSSLLAIHQTATRTWLQLLRAPNLFTVPGDPLGGFLLASGGTLGPSVLAAIGASLALYAAGLLLNDVFDLAEDRAERPERPLPSGSASAIVVRNVAIGLLVVGNALAWIAGTEALSIAIGLTAGILLYNAWAKRVPFLGSLVMGLCRGLSLLLGAAAATTASAPVAVAAAVVTTLYIAAVTNLARYETHAAAPHWARLLPPIPLVGAFAFFLGHATSAWAYPGPATLALAAGLVISEIARLFQPVPPPLPPVIGSLIRALLILQSAWCLIFHPGAAAFLCALALLALWPVSHRVSRRFYAS